MYQYIYFIGYIFRRNAQKTLLMSSFSGSDSDPLKAPCQTTNTMKTQGRVRRLCSRMGACLTVLSVFTPKNGGNTGTAGEVRGSRLAITDGYT